MFASLSIKYQTHRLDVVVGRAWLGTRTLHTQGALDGGGQFNNRSASQKRKNGLVGQAKVKQTGAVESGPRYRILRAALPGAHSWGQE